MKTVFPWPLFLMDINMVLFYNNRFLLGLVDWADIERQFTSSHDGRREVPVVIRLHEIQEGSLLYVLNQGGSPEKVTIQIIQAEEGDYLLEEIFQRRSFTLQTTDKRLQLTTADIPASDVAIYSIWERLNCCKYYQDLL
ncbi:MAG: hypothetical protein KFF73_18660 [Cyclobacteriaceae bacterium]|nr:hypothetical protein [Cyclobacteriaceae bacterium]